MSHRNIADETFGDISQFVTLIRDRSTEESLGVLSEGISLSEPVRPKQQSADSTSNTKVMNEENHPVHEGINEETSFNLKPEPPNLESFNSANIAGSSLPLHMHAGLNTAESEDDSELCSWSGPEMSSDPESWGASDNGSWFQGKTNLSSTCENSDNSTNFTTESSAPIHSTSKSSNSDEKVQMDEPDENPDKSENYNLPGNDLTVEPGLEVNLNKSRDDTFSEENPNANNTSDETSDCETVQCNNCNINDESIDTVISGETKDEDNVDLPPSDTTLDSNNIPSADGIGTKHASDTESISSNTFETDASVADLENADSHDKIDDDMSTRNSDTNGDILIMDEDSDSEISAAQDVNSQGSLANNDEISVNLNEHDDLDIRDEDTEDGCTVLEVWSFFAMTFGAMPYWISNNGRQSQVHRTIGSNILWAFSLIMYAVELVYKIPEIVAVLYASASAETLLYLGIHITFLIFRCACIRTALMKIPNLVDANNILLSFHCVKINNLKAVICFWILVSTAITNTLLVVAFQTHFEEDFTKINFDDVLLNLECVGKNRLTMTTDCRPSKNQPLQIVWAISGFLMTAHEVTMETVFLLGILVLFCSLLFASYNVHGTEMNNANDEFAHITQNDLSNISKLAEYMSKYIGEALVGYLIYHAVYTPSEILFIFMDSPFAILSVLLNHGTIYIGLILGSVASLRIKRISDAITSRDQIEPQQLVRPGTAVILAYIRETVSRRSVGIGLQGVFVINFKITFSYMGVVGAFVTLIL